MKSGNRGLVLPLAILALVVIAVLVACAFASAHLEQRIGQNTVYAVQAAGAAEVGAATLVAEWEAHGLSLLGPGESSALPTQTLPGPSVYTPFVLRLNDQLFWLEVEGIRMARDARPLARRRLGVLLRLVDSAAAGPAGVRPLAHRAWITTPF